MRQATIILSAGVKKNEKGEWVSTDLTIKDAKVSAPGGKLRVIAASYLLKKNPDAVAIIPGGRGHDVVDDEPSRPDLCDILKRELVELGIPPEKIITENKSNKTFEQLQESKKILKKEKFEKIKIISNEYHLARIRAMAENDGDLKEMFDNSRLELISAENVLLHYDKKHWSEMIKNIYDSEEMKQIINNENKGVKQIKEGTYKLR